MAVNMCGIGHILVSSVAPLHAFLSAAPYKPAHTLWASWRRRRYETSDTLITAAPHPGHVLSFCLLVTQPDS